MAAFLTDRPEHRLGMSLQHLFQRVLQVAMGLIVGQSILSSSFPVQVSRLYLSHVFQIARVKARAYQRL